MKRVKIGAKTYEFTTVERVRMGDLIKVEAETFGLLGDVEDGVKQGLTWPYVVRLNEIFAALNDDEVIYHRLFPVFITLIVWASKRNADEEITFFEAADSFTLDDVDMLDEPQDRKEPANPTRRPGKRAGATQPKAGRSKALGTVSNVA